MYRFSSCVFLAVWVLFGMAGGGFAGATHEPGKLTALEQAKAEAQTLLEQKKGQQAYDLYARLLREEPDDDAVNLGLARAAMLAQRPNQAVMAYERLLEKYPREDALHQEIAHAYSMLGDQEKAKSHLDRVGALGGEDADSALAQLNTRYDRLQLHGKLRTGLLYDSNANLGPASNTISLGDFNNVRLSNAEAMPTMAAYLGAQLDVGYRLDQVSPWWIVGEGQFYFRGNSNGELYEIDSQHSEYGRVSAGFRYMGSQNLLDMRVKTEVFDYAFMQSVLGIGPEVTHVWAVTPQVHLITKGGVDIRTYSRVDDLNGWYGYLGQYARLFFGADQHYVTVGARYLASGVENSDRNFSGWEGSAGFTFKLPHKMELSPFVSYAQEYYFGPATALERDDRQDNRLRLGVGLSIPIAESWSIEASYQYSYNNSNSELYEYTQHLVSLGVAWQF